VLLNRLTKGGARTLDEYRSSAGYLALSKSLRKKPTDVLDEIGSSGLRGRGGAGFPTGKKWRAVANQGQPCKYVVANADEGDPGAYIDRFLMEDDPHSLIEGCILAGYAVGARQGIVYLRKEYPDAYRILTGAIEEARNANLLGCDICGSGFAFDLQVIRGQGSYVSGEETALLASLEGKPPMASHRPPYPTERGLNGCPTLVNNVETLANVPWILREGGAAFSRLGFSSSRGTKVVSLNSLFRRPGLYEVEFGVTVRHIVEDLGGGLRESPLKGLIIGGPLAGILPPHLLDVRFGFEELQQLGASVGHGGVVAFDQRTSLPALLAHVFTFAADESCGKCTPCRIGSRVAAEIFSGVRRLEPAEKQRAFAERIVAALRDTSLCGLGTGLAEFAVSAMKHYPEEIARAFGEN
jgi:formate dehydrogenase iron-sulfur subunit